MRASVVVALSAIVLGCASEESAAPSVETGDPSLTTAQIALEEGPEFWGEWMETALPAPPVAPPDFSLEPGFSPVDAFADGDDFIVLRLYVARALDRRIARYSIQRTTIDVESGAVSSEIVAPWRETYPLYHPEMDAVLEWRFEGGEVETGEYWADLFATAFPPGEPPLEFHVASATADFCLVCSAFWHEQYLDRALLRFYMHEGRAVRILHPWDSTAIDYEGSDSFTIESWDGSTWREEYSSSEIPPGGPRFVRNGARVAIMSVTEDGSPLHLDLDLETMEVTTAAAAVPASPAGQTYPGPGPENELFVFASFPIIELYPRRARSFEPRTTGARVGRSPGDRRVYMNGVFGEQDYNGSANHLLNLYFPFSEKARVTVEIPEPEFEWAATASGHLAEVDVGELSVRIRHSTSTPFLPACDDGLACTSVEVWNRDEGRCESEVDPGYCLIDGECEDAGTLGPPCLGCFPSASDQEWSPTAGGACDDGARCTIDDTCVDGVCVGTPRACAAPEDVCLVSECDELTGECVAIAHAEPLPCNDGLNCTQGDRCDLGECIGQPVECDTPPSDCHADWGAYCDESQGCVYPETFPEGFPCDSGGVCISGVCRVLEACLNPTVLELDTPLPLETLARETEYSVCPGSTPQYFIELPPSEGELIVTLDGPSRARAESFNWCRPSALCVEIGEVGDGIALSVGPDENRQMLLQVEGTDLPTHVLVREWIPCGTGGCVCLSDTDCESDSCVDNSCEFVCPEGEEGCPCGDGCDPGLVCEAGTCIVPELEAPDEEPDVGLPDPAQDVGVEDTAEPDAEVGADDTRWDAGNEERLNDSAESDSGGEPEPEAGGADRSGSGCGVVSGPRPDLAWFGAALLALCGRRPANPRRRIAG